MPKKKKKNDVNRGVPGFIIPLILIGIFVAIGTTAYFLITRMSSNNTSYQIPDLGEDQIGIFISGKYLQSINASDKLQRLVENITLTYGFNDVRLLMFGSLGCPHCRSMDAFLSEKYSDVYKVIWITSGSTSSLNLTWFVEMASEEVAHGVPEQYASAVPQILVLDDAGYLRTIVIGEITDKVFWDLLLDKTR